MTHTPEPLAYREADEEEQYMRGCDFVIEQRDFTDNCKQIVAYCDDEHDASRIVACVNACAGKTNEQLEGAAGKLFTGSAIALWSNYCDLKEKNAALSEQVAGLVGAVDIWQENPTTGNGFALIDAATGGAMSIEDKWCWKMDYCKKKGIPAAQEWAWNEAEKALLAAIAKAGSHE